MMIRCSFLRQIVFVEVIRTCSARASSDSRQSPRVHARTAAPAGGHTRDRSSTARHATARPTQRGDLVGKARNILGEALDLGLPLPELSLGAEVGLGEAVGCGAG